MVCLDEFQETKWIQHLKTYRFNYINQVRRKLYLLSSYIGVFLHISHQEWQQKHHDKVQGSSKTKTHQMRGSKEGGTKSELCQVWLHTLTTPVLQELKEEDYQ